MIESKKRSIAKAVSYRFLGSLVTGGIVFFFSERWDVAFGVALVDGVAKMAGYFIHERVWAHVEWGRQKPPNYEI